MRFGVGGRASARLLTLATTALLALTPAVAAADQSHGDDFSRPPAPPAPSGLRALLECDPDGPADTVVGAQGFAISNAWYPTDCQPAEMRPSGSYTLRLVSNGQGDVETMRSSAQRAAAQVLRQTGIEITVAPGTVPDTPTDREPVAGEILLSIDSTATCRSPTWAGCGGPRRFVAWRNGTREAVYSAGRIWVRPAYTTEPLLERDHLVAHELGHVLGLGHFADLYGGQVQVMNGSGAVGSWDAKEFRAGDLNGLSHVVRGSSTVRDDRPAVVEGFGDVGPSTFVTGNDRRVRVSTEVAGVPSAWSSLGGDSRSSPAVVRRRDGSVDVFVLWTDGSVRHKTIGANGVESAWRTTPLSGVSAPAASIRRAPNNAIGWIVDVVVRGPSNDFIVSSYNTLNDRWDPLPYSIGGAFQSAPSITSYFDGGIHIYGRGTDDGVYQKGWDGRAWSNWGWLGGITTTTSPSVTTWYDGNVEMAVRGPDGFVYHAGMANGVWSSSWNQIAGSRSTSAPTLSSASWGQLAVTTRQGEQVARKEYENGWWGWDQFGNPETPASPPAHSAIVEDPDAGTTKVFARDDDGRIRVTTTTGAAQTPWRALSGRVDSAPAAARRRDGTIDLFALIGGVVNHKTITPTGVESAWRATALTGVSAPAAAMRRGSSNTVGWLVDVTVRGVNNDMLIAVYDTLTNRWDTPYSIGGSFQSAPAITSCCEGAVSVVGRGADNGLYIKRWDPSGERWIGWDLIPGMTTLGAPAATSWYDRNVEIGIQSLDGQFTYHGHNGTSWGNWITLDGQITSAPSMSSARWGQLRLYSRQGGQLIRRVWENAAWSGWEPLGNPSLRVTTP